MSNTVPAVSVIVSTRNRAHYLADSLRALAAQQCTQPFEVVVVDNGSTDGTAALLDTWTGRDPRFVRAYEPRLGLSCGKNAGIKCARADLLLFTDDDTLVDPRWVETYLDFFARRRDDGLMVAGGTQFPVPHDLGPWPGWFGTAAFPDVTLLQFADERRLQAPDYVWGANMAVPRRVFERCGNWNENVGPRGTDKTTFEDTEFQDRLRAAGGTVWYCAAAVIHHRVDRRTITPRRIYASAFARGRNDFWKATVAVGQDVSTAPRENVVAAVFGLITSLCRWAWWATAFRLWPRATFFESGRRSAFQAGRTLDSLRAGRRWQRPYLAVSRVVFGVRHFLLRLIPDTP